MEKTSNLEKVIGGLEKLYENCECVTPYDYDCRTCPYESVSRCCEQIIGDAIALLKVQEPRDFHNGFIGLSEQAFFNLQSVKPNAIMHGEMVMYYQCPACLRTIDSGDRFCRHCGKAVKWDD